ncbi:ADP-L-glycero-D-manno-heptose-6-epimerase [Malaciobacter halophilus]|nr:NAD-dependent epimerase/dehydratase family protein [Malaciobacter halophilus]RYA22330.1 ADP-L-glycero-D-manno-heptose-6-epimerase [Malaciobacter halophilus]
MDTIKFIFSFFKLKNFIYKHFLYILQKRTKEKYIKNILVTGGAGFIGSHLCKKLSENLAYKVYSLDNYSTGNKKNHHNGVSYIKGNTTDISSLIDFKVDTIFHLGEYSRVEQSFEDIKTVWKSNKDGIFSVLEFVREKNCKLVYAGSSTKFGDGGLGRSASPYAWTKASNTELVKNYGTWYGIDYAITYFYNVYGKREISTGKYATLIGLFKEKMKKNEPLPIVKPGIQKRNFTHIDDIIEALVLIGEKAYGDDFGIGHFKSYSIEEIAKLFGGKIKYLEERKGNRMNSEVFTSKTEALGWSVKKSLEQYIQNLRKNNWRDL